MNNFYSKTLVFLFMALFVFGLASKVNAETLMIRQGEVLLYPLNIETDVSAYLNNEKMPVFQYGGKGYVLIAVDVNKKVGNYNLSIKSGAKILQKQVVKVKLGSYKKVLTKVPYKFTTLSSKEQAVVAKEKAPLVALLVAAVAEPSPKLRDASFRSPLDEVKTTSSFGYKRIYTNYSTTHQGVDLRAKIGTPVYAVSGGEVLWGEQKALYLEGPTIVINHGEGVVSKYLHLSKVLVQTGDVVSKGDLIGYSGDQGADVNGAHLHFAIKVGNASVNPLQFIQEFQKLK